MLMSMNNVCHFEPICLGPTTYTEIDYFMSFTIRHPRHSSPVVSVVSARSNTVCTAQVSHVINSPSDVWCASRVSVGSLVIHFVHRRSDVIDRRQRVFTTSVRWRHSGVYGSCRPVEIDAFSASSLSASVSFPMRSNRLQLNSDKTEVLWSTTGRRQHQLPTTALSIDGVQVSTVTSVRNLGIFIDSDSDAVARSTNSFGMLRCAPSTASDPQLGADGHIPIIGGRSGAIQTRLRKQRAGRPSDTPGTSPPVGAERSFTVDL